MQPVLVSVEAAYSQTLDLVMATAGIAAPALGLQLVWVRRLACQPAWLSVLQTGYRAMPASVFASPFPSLYVSARRSTLAMESRPVQQLPQSLKQRLSL